MVEVSCPVLPRWDGSIGKTTVFVVQEGNVVKEKGYFSPYKPSLALTEGLFKTMQSPEMYIWFLMKPGS